MLVSLQRVKWHLENESTQVSRRLKRPTSRRIKKNQLETASEERTGYAMLCIDSVNGVLQ
ncbi:hypothetical protein JG687_00018518 [Phytophthora cactorum]|uniref:Uncharacterized protein n=1 Tax=Phytophthora cactorum TaxID=29920 RepID=A0A8T1TKH9_9STRA|nr:hypothetical protein JG687_00018518 [Phytophthora cactorum]